MTAETAGKRAPVFECRPIPVGLFGESDPSYFTDDEADAVAWAKANATRQVEQVTIEVNAPGDVSTFAVRHFTHTGSDTGWLCWRDGSRVNGLTSLDRLFNDRVTA